MNPTLPSPESRVFYFMVTKQAKLAGPVRRREAGAGADDYLLNTVNCVISLQMDQRKDLIKLAGVTRPHGIKGEAELNLLNNIEDSILDEEMQVWLIPTSPKSKLKADGEEWTIQKLRFGNKAICLFAGIKDRTHLETLLPFDLYLSRDQFPEPEGDEVYLVDLIEMPVYSPEGEKLGKLESFSDNGQQYLFDVRLESGERITLPYVDAFFPEIDMENKKIVMILPEYTE